MTTLVEHRLKFSVSANDMFCFNLVLFELSFSAVCELLCIMIVLVGGQKSHHDVRPYIQLLYEVACYAQVSWKFTSIHCNVWH